MTVAGFDVKDTGKAFWKEFQEDELTVRAGNLAYRFFLALFPLLIFLASAGTIVAETAGVDDPTAEVMDAIGDTLPEDASSVLEGQIDGVVDSSGEPLALLIGLVGALWAASGGVGSLLKSINAMYDEAPKRPFWKSTPLAIAVTSIGGLATIALLSGVITAQVFAEDIATGLGVGGAYNLVVGLLQIPVVLLVLMLVVTVLYRIAPAVENSFKWSLPGAVAFVLLWAPFTIGFAFYVANIASFNATYGAIGGVVILLLWIYYTSLLLLLGGELNAVLVRQSQGQAAVATPALAAEMSSASRRQTPAQQDGSVPAQQGNHYGPRLVGIASLALALMAYRRFSRS